MLPKLLEQILHFQLQNSKPNEDRCFRLSQCRQFSSPSPWNSTKLYQKYHEKRRASLGCQMQTVESISTAKINISPVTLKHLHSSQLLPKNRIMHCSEASIVSLIHPLPLALPVELRISGSALFIEGENELNGLCIAVVCCDVKQRASGPIDEVVDVGKVLSY